MLRDFATSIVQTLRQHGFQAYLVGGCVRDLLLGREPKDYDVATDATPKQVMEIFPETYAVGVQFGVVLVPAPEAARARISDEGPAKSSAVEVATFREIRVSDRARNVCGDPGSGRTNSSGLAGAGARGTYAHVDRRPRPAGLPVAR